jgi:serine/threonine-protein kinase
VPDVLNQEQESALAKLRAAGFKSRVKTVPTSAAAGVVVQESPAGGTTARKGSAITLRVSVRRARTRPLAKGVVIVPSVVGLGKTVAQSNLTAAGLGARISYVVSARPPGQVIAQSPAGGALLKRGKKVDLSVSWAPEGAYG